MYLNTKIILYKLTFYYFKIKIMLTINLIALMVVGIECRMKNIYNISY